MKLKLFAFSLLLMVAGHVHAQMGDLSRINLLTYGGLPVMDSSLAIPRILINTAYISAYEENLRNPVWVAFRLGNAKGTLSVQNWERPDRFVADERTSSRVDHDAYNSTGYDRGHMAPNATMLSQYGQIGQLETYLMTNICPQKPALNQRIWSELEKQERDIISQDDTPGKEVHDVYVITGPIFGQTPARITQNVAVPESFYRIIAYRKGYNATLKAVAFIIPQDPPTQNLKDYYTTVDRIEQLTHINFFPKLSETVQRNLESKKRDMQLIDLP
ncbi:DNA/RNA non-specific endonuclease [Mucilaginibacter sp. HD30]